MNQKSDAVETKVEKCKREEKTSKQFQRHGHRDILTLDPESKMEAVTSYTAVYIPPKWPGVRMRGIRSELLEKGIAQEIREKMQRELKLPTSKTDFCSTTQKDFSVQGFVSLTPETKGHDYKTDQAITFWSEKCQRIQGVTAMQNQRKPFRKSAMFSKPHPERLDDIDLQHDE